MFAAAAFSLVGWIAVNCAQSCAEGQTSSIVWNVGFGVAILGGLAAFVIIRTGVEEYRFDARELVVTTKLGVPLRVRRFALTDVAAITIEETRHAKSPIPTRQLGIHWRGRMTRTWLMLDDDVLFPLVELLRREVSSRVQQSRAPTPDAGI